MKVRLFTLSILIGLVAGGPSTGSGRWYAYVAAGATGLHVIDVSDPGSPQAVANCQTLGRPEM